MSAARERASAPPSRIGTRYRVLSELGRGGMAAVYRVVDETTGQELALKQLSAPGNEAQRARLIALFEREFHTLAQMSHPRVIAVHDYGGVDATPYYTMELLDGGDLRELSPLPWRKACELMFDVCSSLALLHSRGLLHRDISPRNVRCTREGSAKLIDFGAMAPIGRTGQVVGTAAFVAPEVVHRSTLDARTDLYSLGATLYYALTGRMPYPARHLSDVLRAWGTKPAPPSLLVPDIPAELDALVLSLIDLEPALRPRTAFEVMQRLAALAELRRDEPLGVSQAYLATPVLVGREPALAEFRSQMQRALRMRGSGLFVAAATGLGRSRLLDACVLEGKLLGATALRAAAAGAGSGSGARGSRLAVAQQLAEQLLEALPEPARSAARDAGVETALFAAEEPSPAVDAGAPAPQPGLRDLGAAAGDPLELQSALADWFSTIARRHTLLVAVDDADRSDAASAAVLAALAHRAPRQRLLVLVAAESTASPDIPALEVLAGACRPLALPPLDRAQTEALLGSVFGDVPNLALLAERVHALAQGSPRECMALAQELIERGLIAYQSGTWTLPEQLGPDDLPPRVEDVLRARVAALGPLARRLCAAQALAALDALARPDYDLLGGGAAGVEIDAALAELVAREVLASDGQLYTLGRRVPRALLLEGTGAEQQQASHRALAALCERRGAHAFVRARHLFAAELAEPALALVTAALGELGERSDPHVLWQISVAEIAATIERAHAAACELGRPARERCELLRALMSLSTVGDDRLYTLSAPPLLAQLMLDSGLAFFREPSEHAEPMPRLMAALKRAGARYEAASAHERVYRPDEAIKHLVRYVVTSIVHGARAFDSALLGSLPPLLEPFAPLSPLLHALWQNALATHEATSRRQPERARGRWLDVHARLGQPMGAELQYVGAVRNAIAFALGSLEAQLGIASAARWAEAMDADPAQRVNAMYLRRMICLQRGDFEGGERFRRRAEVLAVQSTVRQMFTNMLAVELFVHAAARDLTGVKHLLDRIVPLAERHPGWVPYRHLAEAHLHRLRGDLAAACSACERGLALCTPDPAQPERTIVAWPSTASAYLEVLCELGRHAEAYAFGECALQTCGELEIGLGSFEITRNLAPSQARLGDYAGAAARLEALIAAQQELGVTGLSLGVSYETRARIAIWAGDSAAVERYANQAMREYRHGRNSPLGARYERLVREAQSAGVHALPQLSAFESSVLGSTALGGTRALLETSVSDALQNADGARGRAERALGLLSDAYGASAGHLYLAGESGLGHAASLGGDSPETDLATVLHSYWRQQIDALDMPTEHEVGSSAGSLPVESFITDARGVAYRPVLLSTIVDGATVFAGVALLLRGEGERSTGAGQVTSAVAALLVRAGDTQGRKV